MRSFVFVFASGPRHHINPQHELTHLGPLLSTFTVGSALTSVRRLQDFSFLSFVTEPQNRRFASLASCPRHIILKVFKSDQGKKSAGRRMVHLLLKFWKILLYQYSIDVFVFWDNGASIYKPARWPVEHSQISARRYLDLMCSLSSLKTACPSAGNRSRVFIFHSTLVESPETEYWPDALDEKFVCICGYCRESSRESHWTCLATTDCFHPSGKISTMAGVPCFSQTCHENLCGRL